MKTWAAIFYSVSVLAELAGILVVIEFRANSADLRESNKADPNDKPEPTQGQQTLINKIVTGLIGASQRRVPGVVLLVSGITAGTLGNFLSLYM